MCYINKQTSLYVYSGYLINPAPAPFPVGLLPSLEKIHSSLVDCQTALVRYVEGQRVKCPWFYFLPLEDILQFMCYGAWVGIALGFRSGCP